MKKIIAMLICLVIIVTSCTSSKKEAPKHDQSDKMEDSVFVDADEFVLIEENTIEDIQEDVVPMRADELFDDFLYHYASNPRIQKRRTVFPLPYYSSDSHSYIEKEEWVHDSLFFVREGYTLLFDDEEGMDLTESTELTSVQYEQMFMESRKVKRYYFERKEGAWVLEGIHEFILEESEKEDFVSFLYQFATDSLFQEERIQQPLLFVTTDPDDDFSILETTIDRTQWKAFKPVLPKEKLSNINYGQRNSERSRTKILMLKGIGNGFSNSLYFRKNGGKWVLYKFEDTSN